MRFDRLTRHKRRSDRDTATQLAGVLRAKAELVEHAFTVDEALGVFTIHDDVERILRETHPAAPGRFIALIDQVALIHSRCHERIRDSGAVEEFADELADYRLQAATKAPARELRALAADLDT